MKPSVARVTLRQLLTMTGGFPDTNTTRREIRTPPDWVRYILTRQDTAPGAEFHYSDYGAHLLAPILVQATGKSVLAYARAKLFDPLGIVTRPGVEPRLTAQTLLQALAAYAKAGFGWPIDPQGFHLTESLIKLRHRDMATFGQLFLQTVTMERPAGRASNVGESGNHRASRQSLPRWQSRCLRPDELRLLLVGAVAAGPAAYAALGFGGQLVDVVPSLHLVIVVSSYVDETNPHPPVVENDELRRLVNAIVPIIKTQPRH